MTKPTNRYFKLIQLKTHLVYGELRRPLVPVDHNAIQTAVGQVVAAFGAFDIFLAMEDVHADR